MFGARGYEVIYIYIYIYIYQLTRGYAGIIKRSCGLLSHISVNISAFSSFRFKSSSFHEYHVKLKTYWYLILVPGMYQVLSYVSVCSLFSRVFRKVFRGGVSLFSSADAEQRMYKICTHEYLILLYRQARESYRYIFEHSNPSPLLASGHNPNDEPRTSTRRPSVSERQAR